VSSQYPSAIVLAFRPTPSVDGTQPKIHINDERPVNSGETSVSNLYPLAKEINPQLYGAMALLDEGITLLRNGAGALKEGNAIAADNYTLSVRALMPDLFCCDGLGDGFRAIVLATMHSLINLEGAPLSAVQFAAIEDTLEKLRKEPFLDFDGALAVHEKLETVELLPDPVTLDLIADIVEEIAVGAPAETAQSAS
jgi:hypothetical protein